jgi:hypothetical protein
MQMNISKTIITGLNLDMATEAIPEGFRVSHQGLKTVGGWAGTDIAKNYFHEKMLDKWAPLTPLSFFLPRRLCRL